MWKRKAAAGKVKGKGAFGFWLLAISFWLFSQEEALGYAVGYTQ